METDFRVIEPRVLVVIPAFNEEKSIAAVLLELRRIAPDYDRVVVNDGSRDSTGRIVEEMGEKQIKLACNLGYGKAVQTGFKFALIRGYETVVSFDADGQHLPEDVPRLVNELRASDAGLVIGSRFNENRPYTGALGRKLGQILFSHITRLLIGQRIYDTTSGLKAFHSSALALVANGTFLDFHTETIVRLSLSGCKITEIPITVRPRNSGQSMYSLVSFIEYPAKTLLFTLVAAVDALLARRAR